MCPQTFSWRSPNLFCTFILSFVQNLHVLWLYHVPSSIISWKFQFPALKESLMIMRGLKLFKQKGSLSQFCILLLIKTRRMHLHQQRAQPTMLHMGLAAGIQGQLKKLPISQRFKDDLAEVSFVKCQIFQNGWIISLETFWGIKEPNSAMARAAHQHSPARRGGGEMGNRKILMDPERFFYDALSRFSPSALAVLYFLAILYWLCFNWASNT